MPTLLIIDDDPFVREVTEMSFTSAGGWNVVAAPTARIGLELARTGPVPDVILLDYVMPDMNGRAALAALHEDAATRDIPVVFVSADERSVRNAPEFAAAGVLGVIAKPFDPMTLPDEIAALIAAPTPAPDDHHDALGDALAQLWEERRPETMAAAAELEAALASGEAGWAHARQLAHNLAGVLGSLGLYRSSELARAIDSNLRGAEGDEADAHDRAKLQSLAADLQAQLAVERPSL